MTLRTYKCGFHGDARLEVDHRGVVEPEDELRLAHVVPGEFLIEPSSFRIFLIQLILYLMGRASFEFFSPEFADDDNTVAKVDVLLPRPKNGRPLIDDAL